MENNEHLKWKRISHSILKLNNTMTILFLYLKSKEMIDISKSQCYLKHPDLIQAFSRSVCDKKYSDKSETPKNQLKTIRFYYASQ